VRECHQKAVPNYAQSMSHPQQVLNSRMHALIEALRGKLPEDTVALAGEMVDANEAPIALDMLSEMLVETGSRVSHDVIAEFAALATSLGLDSVTAGRLRR
jgi:hypothetical protein